MERWNGENIVEGYNSKTCESDVWIVSATTTTETNYYSYVELITLNGGEKNN